MSELRFADSEEPERAEVARPYVSPYQPTPMVYQPAARPLGGGLVEQPNGYIRPARYAQENGAGTAALVCGLTAFGLPLLAFLIALATQSYFTMPTGLISLGLAIVAIIQGHAGRRKANAGVATNGGAALTGMVLGYVYVGLLVLGIVIIFAFFATMLSML